MNSAVLELAYLPNVIWFKNFLKHETIFIEREENFVKSSFRNRCEIAGPTGKQILSVPVVGGRDHHQLYKEVRIAFDNNWNNKHWQSIRSAYGSAPYFEFYADKFQPLFEKRFEFLFDLNIELLYAILHIFKVRKCFDFTSIYETAGGEIFHLRTGSAIPCRHTGIKSLAEYFQVFEGRNGFIHNLSIIDVIFNLGPETKNYLQK